MLKRVCSIILAALLVLPFASCADEGGAPAETTADESIQAVSGSIALSEYKIIYSDGYKDAALSLYETLAQICENLKRAEELLICDSEQG